MLEELVVGNEMSTVTLVGRAQAKQLLQTWGHGE